MANEDLNAEIELLRKQLDALQRERESSAEKAEPEEKEAVEQFGSSDSGASLGDILGEALKKDGDE